MYKCECGNSEFTMYVKKYFNITINGEGLIKSEEYDEFGDEESETMECTDCGLEQDTSEVY